MQIKEALATGTILNSGTRKYEIKKVLGQGGFGITYLATSIVDVDNIPIEAQFAIKEHYISSMNERQGTSVAISNENNTAEIKESIDSFIVEAQRLNKLSLNHPGIVRVNESFRANGTAYYVMEYIKGQSLREFVKHSSGGRLSEEEALKLFRPIAETIGYLHENKVTHLDIKPDNILIRENGQPVIIDFGLSKHYSSKGTPTSTIKAAGCSAGYSPMEQYVGITTFTPEADIYALAATLLYMLTGKDPIISTEITPDIICNSLPVEVSEQTKEAIVKGMAKLKEDRMNNIQGFFTDTDSEALFTTISAPEDTNKTIKKKPASQKRKTQYTAEGNNPSAVSSPVKAIKLAFSRLFDFKGKSTRMEFWCIIPLLMILYGLSLFIAVVGSPSHNIIYKTISLLGSVFALFSMCGVCIRRLRDTERSGWWVIFPIFLLEGIILCIDSINLSYAIIVFAIPSLLSLIVVFFCAQDSLRSNKGKAVITSILFVVLFSVFLLIVFWLSLSYRSNLIEKHEYEILSDYSQLRIGDFYYSDGTFSHKKNNAKKYVGRVFSLETTDEEKKHGWIHGYIASPDIVLLYKTWGKSIDLPDPYYNYPDERNALHDNNGYSHSLAVKDRDDIDKFPFFCIKSNAGNLPNNTSGWFVPSLGQLWKSSRFIVAKEVNISNEISGEGSIILSSTEANENEVWGIAAFWDSQKDGLHFMSSYPKKFKKSQNHTCVQFVAAF